MPAIADGDRVLVLCGDVPLITAKTLDRLLDAGDATDLAILTANVDDPTGYGRILRGANGAVTGIVEQKDATPGQLALQEINTGIITATAGSLRGWLGRVKNDNSQGEYYLTDVVGLANDDGVTVAAATLDDPAEAMGINDKAQLAAAERILQRRLTGGLLAAGATLADPARVDVRGEVSVGKDVFIDVGVVFAGRVALGDGCTIGPYCVISDSTLGAGTAVAPHCVIDGAVTGEKCSIGPFARVRPGTVMAERVRVGNFVETKNLQIAAGSKANHLSYLGDATVGANVNIGAGTITCNYDGANKHRTTIGDGAFIGSGSNLVAPVQIGAGATVGAGSTVSRHVPDDKLTVARSRQTVVEGWKRPVRKDG